MLNSQPPDRTISKSRYLLARLLPFVYMLVTTLALPMLFPAGELSELEEEKLQQRIRSIGVRIRARTQALGSGIILSRKDKVYTVVTNTHIIQSGAAPFEVQTPDGQTYAAALVPPPLNQTEDLAILRFISKEREYSTAKRSSSPLKIGDRVWAAGYPLESTSINRDRVDKWGLMIIKGTVARLLPKPLTGGYNIGYDNPISKGMSGGPLLNQQGELIGINGRHADPLSDVPNALEDGSTPESQLQQEIDRLNWAIPIALVD
jgi:S1-C subfamily serine protease